MGWAPIHYVYANGPPPPGTRQRRVIWGVGEVCLLIRNETVKETTIKKKIPKSENRLHPPVYCFALTFNNNSLLFFSVFVSYPLLVPRAGAQWLLSSAGDPEIPLCLVFTHERTIINKKKKSNYPEGLF